MSEQDELQPIPVRGKSTHGCVRDDPCPYCRLKEDFGLDQTAEYYNVILSLTRQKEELLRRIDVLTSEAKP